MLASSLDAAYSYSIGDTSMSSSYHWCQCGGSFKYSLTEIVIICIAIMGIMAGIKVTIWYLYRHKGDI